jgi:hypothetical protein
VSAIDNTLAQTATLIQQMTPSPVATPSVQPRPDIIHRDRGDQRGGIRGPDEFAVYFQSGSETRKKPATAEVVELPRRAEPVRKEARRRAPEKKLTRVEPSPLIQPALRMLKPAPEPVRSRTKETPRTVERRTAEAPQPVPMRPALHVSWKQETPQEKWKPTIAVIRKVAPQREPDRPVHAGTPAMQAISAEPRPSNLSVKLQDAVRRIPDAPAQKRETPVVRRVTRVTSPSRPDTPPMPVLTRTLPPITQPERPAISIASPQRVRTTPSALKIKEVSAPSLQVAPAKTTVQRRETVSTQQSEQVQPAAIQVPAVSQSVTRQETRTVAPVSRAASTESQKADRETHSPPRSNNRTVQTEPKKSTNRQMQTLDASESVAYHHAPRKSQNAPVNTAEQSAVSSRVQSHTYTHMQNQSYAGNTVSHSDAAVRSHSHVSETASAVDSSYVPDNETAEAVLVQQPAPEEVKRTVSLHKPPVARSSKRKSGSTVRKSVRSVRVSRSTTVKQKGGQALSMVVETGGFDASSIRSTIQAALRGVHL